MATPDTIKLPETIEEELSRKAIMLGVRKKDIVEIALRLYLDHLDNIEKIQSKKIQKFDPYTLLMADSIPSEKKRSLDQDLMLKAGENIKDYLAETEKSLESD